jgi:hypothetical protein
MIRQKAKVDYTTTSFIKYFKTIAISSLSTTSYSAPSSSFSPYYLLASSSISVHLVDPSARSIRFQPSRPERVSISR